MNADFSTEYLRLSAVFKEETADERGLDADEHRFFV
jgi:hypothetical protein